MLVLCVVVNALERLGRRIGSRTSFVSNIRPKLIHQIGPRAAWDETIEQLDVVKRENKNLADEIKDLLDQLGDGGRSIHELDKQRRRLEVEKEELQGPILQNSVSAENFLIK
jgi:peptidoglycan hydrolase CwlO-like protein